MKNTYSKYLGLVIMAMLFSSYGNVNTHPSINQFIVESFVNRYSKFEANLPRFKNYRFNFDKQTFKGDYIVKSGLLHASDYEKKLLQGDYKKVKQKVAYVLTDNKYIIDDAPTYTEANGNKTAKEWIKHGGYSADVPSVHASLRHFYDPKKEEPERYLTDEVNSVFMRKLQSLIENPKINGVDWALGDKGGLEVLGQNYSWELGKKYMKGALEEADLTKRNRYMARAWRSLGETLHMIADNGCPPHVRNDGHPPGNADPYEEMIEAMNISPFKSGAVPATMKSKFNDPKITTRKIAHELAVFTNENFFSNETIAGTDRKGNKIKHIAHSSDEYSSPKISKANYIFRDQCYHNKIEGQDVLMCTDKFYFGQYNFMSYYPFIDEGCVKSQANILIPTIIEAGTNVMKWYIPELKVNITSIDENGNIEGEIIHYTDNEYKSTIKYNGPVSIKTITLEEMALIQAQNGKFSGRIEETDLDVFAEIEFGGISVRSENKETKFNKPKSESISFAGREIDEISFEINGNVTTTEGEKYLSSFTRNSFYNKGKYQNGYASEYHKITSSNTQMFAEFTHYYKKEGGGNYRSAEVNDKMELKLIFDESENLTGFQFDENDIGIYGSEKETVTRKFAIKVSNVPFKKNANKSEYAKKTFFSYSFKGDISPYLIQCDGDYYLPNGKKTNEKFIKTDNNWKIDIDVICSD
jgi:hypothetical protein